MLVEQDRKKREKFYVRDSSLVLLCTQEILYKSKVKDEKKGYTQHFLWGETKIVKTKYCAQFRKLYWLTLMMHAVTTKLT